mgnify:FL=1
MRKRLAARLPSEEPRKRSGEKRVLGCHLRKPGETRPKPLGIDLAHRNHRVRYPRIKRRRNGVPKLVPEYWMVPIGARPLQSGQDKGPGGFGRQQTSPLQEDGATARSCHQPIRNPDRRRRAGTVVRATEDVVDCEEPVKLIARAYTDGPQYVGVYVIAYTDPRPPSSRCTVPAPPVLVAGLADDDEQPRGGTFHTRRR